MPFDQNGNFKRIYGPTGWQDDRDAGTNILATRHDDDDNDKAEAFNQCFLSDGRKAATGAFKMGGNKITGVGEASAPLDVPATKQVQANAFNFGKDISAEANIIKVNLIPAPEKLPNSMVVSVQVSNDNTGPATLQLNTLEAKPILFGEQELSEGLLRAGKTYLFFYNGALGAFQIMTSGSFVGRSVAPGSMIMVDHLLTGEDAVGYELQGTRCYKGKYWQYYQKLVEEYSEAVERTETIGETQFTYKVNLDSMRRFYSKNDYDSRFALCGDSGGWVLDEETFSFYLPKSNNYFRPAVDADNLSAYQKDTMRPLTGMFSGFDRGNRGKYEGMFKVESRFSANAESGGSDDWGTHVKADSTTLGEHYAGEETAPKSRFVAVYYYLGVFYTTPVEQLLGTEGGGGGGEPPVLTWYKEQEGATITAVGLEDAELVKVYKNGLLLEPEADYTISGEEITFVTALELSDKITTEVY